MSAKKKWALGDVAVVGPDGQFMRTDLKVVVIDPEDREQVALLLSRYHSWKWTAEVAEASITDMQAALRSLVADPEPEEPTGLGAVAQSGDGERWVHRGLSTWVPAEGTGWHSWGDLPRPLTVLSPGWEPEQ